MGHKWSALKQFYPPKSEFSVDQIPDLTGKVVVVTGGYVGIGYETVRVLLARGAKVYIASRSVEKAEKAIASLKSETGKEPLFIQLDLADLHSVKKAAVEYLSKENTLDILFNNAGVMMCPQSMLTAQGIDLQFGTNVLGHWYFTELLMPALIAAAEASSDHHARVITTSSSGAYSETLHFDTFNDGPRARRCRPRSSTSRANVVVARQVAKRYAEKGIISISLNPGARTPTFPTSTGNISTELQRHELVMLYPTPYGALTQLYAGTMPEAVNHNGEFFIPWARPGKCRPEAYDDAIGERLWTWCEDTVKELA
ncbi:NAD(P)-binding protein [Epithele typhae]|uniref:NAD(P)-binding protein n=1 Tax=Epithele typhae TaxID=378194 RepID=UPI00200773E0|nr:NAD(P)-binding protein [Epithele typhae]KAH9925604.1 NAD(P)-binding protein [Epithele typhae]